MTFGLIFKMLSVNNPARLNQTVQPKKGYFCSKINGMIVSVNCKRTNFNAIAQKYYHSYLLNKKKHIQPILSVIRHRKQKQKPIQRDRQIERGTEKERHIDTHIARYI